MEERVERRGGRLDLPALFALDELANVVRWAGVPDQFSHYGSKGLIVMGILQSRSQGVELWRDAKMAKAPPEGDIRDFIMQGPPDSPPKLWALQIFWTPGRFVAGYWESMR
jgi:hypothetical protein